MNASGDMSGETFVVDGASLRRFSRGLPALLLLLATLSSVFWFGNERELFYRWHPHHNAISSQSLALAENLSPEHRFLGFYAQYGRLDKPPVYYLYNRFPIVNHALVKLVMLPFGDDIKAKIYAARMLMLAFFVAAGVLAWLSLRRLFSDEAAALIATLLTFSSSRFLFFSDMVSMEIPSLFGVLLAFHGMTVFVQEGRFGQLLLKTGIAILLSLQVMGFVLAFTALGLGYELFRSVKRHSSDHTPLPPRLWSRLVTTLASSLYLRLGVMAALFFALVAGLPLWNEYMALGGSLSFFELPSVRAALKRTAIDLQYLASYSAKLEWSAFLPEQLTRIGRLVIPYAALELTSYNYMPRGPAFRPGLAVLGVVVIAVCIRFAVVSRYRILTGTLLLSGWFWSLPVRAHSAFHVYDALFYVGIPLIFWSWAFLRAAALLERKRGGPSVARFTAGSIAATVAIFCLSSFGMGKIEHWPKGGPEFVEDTTADFQTIRRLTEPRDRIIIIFRELSGSLDWHPQVEMTGAARGVYFYLSGRIIKGEREVTKWSADYVVSGRRIESPALLTPENRRVFLYDRKLLLEPERLRLSEQ